MSTWSALLLLLPALGGGEAAGPLPDPACPEGRVSEIRIRNPGLFDLAEVSPDATFRWAFELADRIHVPTRESVIRRDLLLQEGDCFDPELVPESERLLRASSYVARADIQVEHVREGAEVRLEVDIRDDWAWQIVPLTLHDPDFRVAGIAVRQENLAGTGQRVGVFAGERYDRPHYGGWYGHPQLLGSRLRADFALERTPTGFHLSETLAWPFSGVPGRWAVRQQVTMDDRYFDFIAFNGDQPLEVLLPERRRAFDLGAVYRFRGIQRTALLGAAIAGEMITYPGEPRLYRRAGPEPGPEEVPLAHVQATMDSVAGTRALVLLGHRNVRFTPRLGIDAIRGVEDVRLGVEAEMALGRTIAALSTEDDLSLDLGLSVAGEPYGRFLVGGLLTFEGKLDYDGPAESDEWRDLFASANLWAYHRASATARTTLVATFRASGGWHTTIPFQLTLGGETGVRGYSGHLDPGGQRLVATLEHRYYLGWFPELVDLGSVLFVDAGRVWAGDVPFGVRSPNRFGVGGGLRLAMPPGSRSTLRVDLALPVSRGSFGDLRLEVGIGQAVGRTAPGEDPQLRRSSRRGISTSLFTYPD